MSDYLQPTTATPEGVSFRRLLQEVFVGLSGLRGDLVRPAWQSDPPPPPPAGTRWMAIRISRQSGTTDAQVHSATEDAAILQREERVEVLVSVYGEEPCDFAAQVRDGLFVPPNRYELRSAGIAFQGAGDILHVPELDGQQWRDRADFIVTLDREVKRSYRILRIADAFGVIHGNGPDPTLNSVFDTRST